MNLTYQRKSKRDYKETISNLEKSAEKADWKVIGKTEIKKPEGIVVSMVNTSLMEDVMQIDPQLTAFIPTSFIVYKKGKDIIVSAVNSGVINSIVNHPKVKPLADKAQEQTKELIHQAADVSELKPKNVTLYSTMSCPYCKMEEAWLKDNKIEHEVVHVDLDQEAGRKMVEKTGQMGVPVTEIEYDEGESEYIIGFDKNRLGQALQVTA